MFQRSGALIALLAISGALIVGTVGLFVGRVWGDLHREERVTIVRTTPSVIVAVRDLARLEGAEFHIERVISLTEKQRRFFGLLETRDAILLVAAGSVTAGVDLGGLAATDLVLDETRHAARISLPESAILSSRLDNGHTFVFDRRTDLLAERQESLESRAREEAERSIVEAARDGGILKRSNDSVRRTVEGLLHSFGYKDVVVTFHSAPAPAPAGN